MDSTTQRPPSIGESTFTCASCGGTFNKSWTDEEAATEAKQNFPGVPLSSMAVVCDNCYNQLMHEGDDEEDESC